MILRYFPAVVLGMSLFLPVASALADATGMPGRGGDGHCPIKESTTDPDCAREGFQYRGSGRIDDQVNGRRDEFPKKTVGYSKSDRNSFPKDRRGSGGPVPRAGK